LFAAAAGISRPDQAFDIAAGFALNYPSTNAFSVAALEGMIGNLNYEGGCNPVNICYLTGLGWKRPREIVHHYAMNDRRILPPTGIPVGNIQAGFAWLDAYKQELGALCFRPTERKKDPIQSMTAGATASTCKLNSSP
jgi:hypothetical protein